ncbi:MAG: TIGR01212 family radical SAM protein [Clostridia bacterium]|nr:TIGR01212 family radical SAM protein [Clostridia bacterium]
MYRTFDSEMKRLFGRKVWKLSLDGGMTCPNRDGKAGFGGCVFCAGGGRFVPDANIGIEEQIRKAREILGEKAEKAGFLAYFQSGTNTYASEDALRRLFLPVMMREDILGMSVGTRPDCLEDGVCGVLDELGKIKPLWVELGLQTSNDETARRINRGYSCDVFDNAMEKLAKLSVNRVVHVIIGLPGETEADVFETVSHVSRFHPEGVKFHLLHVMRGTELEKMWQRGEVESISLEKYADIVSECVRLIPPETVVHRITGDGDKRLLLSPTWSGDKKRVLNTLNRALDKVVQGEKFSEVKKK